MTIGQYTTASGLAGPDEQATIVHLDAFITGALGWQRLDSFQANATDTSLVWRSHGEVPGKYAPIYFRAQAVGNDIRFSTYTYWNQVAHTGNDEIAEVTELQVPNDNATGPDEYVFCGNKDFVYVSIRLDSNGTCYLGGGGYWDTYYTAEQDPYPMAVFGQNAAADLFSTTSRVRSYAYTPGGYLNVAATYSGSNTVYNAQDRSFLTAVGAPNKRDGRYLMLKQDFYTTRAQTAGTVPGMIAHETRGELPGLYQFYGADFIAHERIVASGISIGDGITGNQVGQGDWVVIRSSTTNTYAIGPTISWDQVPNTIPNIELWLGAGAYHEEEGGGITGLIDLSTNTNEAVQTTTAQQPQPVSSGTNYNGAPIAAFSSTQHLTGTLSYVDNYTAFAVADYSSSSQRSPILNIRGAVSANDTILSLEFNPSVNNTAEVTSRTDDAPAELDVERYSGLVQDTPYIISAVVSGTTTTLYVNGDATGSATVTDTRVSTPGNTELSYAIGATLDASGSVDGVAKHSGNIAEVVVYARNLTAEEHQSVICYLGNKYAITVSGTCA